jgi:hypothetical protein
MARNVALRAKGAVWVATNCVVLEGLNPSPGIDLSYPLACCMSHEKMENDKDLISERFPQHLISATMHD